MSEFVENFMLKTHVSDSFLATTNFTYDQLYAITNYRKDQK